MVKIVNQYLRRAAECLTTAERVMVGYSEDVDIGVRQSQFERAGANFSMYLAQMAFYGRDHEESGDNSHEPTADLLGSRATRLMTWLVEIKESLPGGGE